MTNEQIRKRLVHVDPAQLTGKVPQRLRQIEQISGVDSHDVLAYYARTGHTWADAADFVGVRPNALIQYCRKLGWAFPWQGVRSEQSRYRQSRAMRGRFGGGPRAKQYTAFGVTGSLRELHMQFQTEGMHLETVRRRVVAGWPIEAALTTPQRDPLKNMQKVG